MGKSRAQKKREKAVREGKLDATIKRGTWQRKPQTQAVPNKKAEQSKTACRGA